MFFFGDCQNYIIINSNDEKLLKKFLKINNFQKKCYEKPKSKIKYFFSTFSPIETDYENADIKPKSVETKKIFDDHLAIAKWGVKHDVNVLNVKMRMTDSTINRHVNNMDSNRFVLEFTTHYQPPLAFLDNLRNQYEIDSIEIYYWKLANATLGWQTDGNKNQEISISYLNSLKMKNTQSDSDSFVSFDPNHHSMNFKSLGLLDDEHTLYLNLFQKFCGLFNIEEYLEQKPKTLMDVLIESQYGSNTKNVKKQFDSFLNSKKLSKLISLSNATLSEFDFCIVTQIEFKTKEFVELVDFDILHLDNKFELLGEEVVSIKYFVGMTNPHSFNRKLFPFSNKALGDLRIKGLKKDIFDEIERINGKVASLLEYDQPEYDVDESED